MQSISSIVNPEDYLLGRRIDKTFELSQKEKLEKQKESREQLIASDQLKLKADPIVELERRKRNLKYQILTDPFKLKQFKDYLRKKGIIKDSERARPNTHSRHNSRRHGDRQIDHSKEDKQYERRGHKHNHRSRHGSRDRHISRSASRSPDRHRRSRSNRNHRGSERLIDHDEVRQGDRRDHSRHIHETDYDSKRRSHSRSPSRHDHRSKQRHRNGDSGRR